MPRKIFELAKELEIKPLDFVEELKAKGYSVKNHMSILTDDEVEAILAKRGDEGSSKSASKKKTVRKKTAKKKVVKKVVAKESTESSDDETSQKSAVRKKTTVIRRKTTDAIEEEVLETQSEEIVETPVIIETKKAEVPNIIEEKVEAKNPVKAVDATAVVEQKPVTGLRVVKNVPEVKVIKKADREAAKIEKKAAVEAEAKSELYREKVHKFTPVYIPPKKEKVEEKPTAEKTTTTTGTTAATTAAADGKKRIAGLATMLATGKKVVSSFNKAQVLNQSRADSELKSYAAQSGTGKPIYTTIKKKRIYSGPSSSTSITEIKDAKRVVYLHKGALVEQLAKKLSVKLKDMIDKCLDINLLIKNGDYVGMLLSSKIAALYDYRVDNKAFNEDAVIGKSEVDDEVKNSYPTRNPVIAIMGHVDHGKTTLLDYIRKEKVADGEAGGITQHIGAYSVDIGDKSLTFLDTPGHAAFASMRQRGAQITDMVILVVAGDDGVMPQTRESIKYCEQAGVPLIVAVNKMDKEGINSDRVKQELSECGITPEDWGGETQFVNISALKGDGVNELLDALALQSEILELRANNKGKAEGVVIESRVEQGRGPVATVLIQSGILKKGDSIVVGETFGRARSLTGHTGIQLDNVGPSTPVQILGLEKAPSPGDTLDVVKNEREAKKIVNNRINERKILEAAPKKEKISLEDFFGASADSHSEKKKLNLIIRSDVQGSYEAIHQALSALSNNEVEVRIIAGGVGAISDSDVQLAETAGGFIIGFNMRPVTTARRMADDKGVDVKTYTIIYELINDVTMAIEGLLDPDTTEEFIGRAEVRETFSVPKIGLIAGSYVIDGAIKTGCNIRLLRNGKIMFDGKMSSLKRFKDDAKEVKNGYECGIALDGYTDIKEKDVFEAYILVEKKRTLEDVAKAEAILLKEKEEMAAAMSDAEA